VPPAVVESWSDIIGDWIVEGQIGSTPVKGSASFEWASDKHCYIGRQDWTVGEGGRGVRLTLIGGWDAETNETVEHGFSSSGESATIRYVANSPGEVAGVMHGQIAGTNPLREAWAGTVERNQRGPDEFTLTTAIVGEVVHSLKFVRKQRGGARIQHAKFNPLPLDHPWCQWIVGEWTGTGESDAGSGHGTTRVELALNGQFLIFTGEAEVTDISAEQRQVLKSQLHASDEEIERFKNSPFRGLEIYTIDQETGEVVGYLFDSLRSMATGRGEWTGDTHTMRWQWATGHTSTRITRKLGDDRLAMVERIAMPDGSTMEESGEMVRKK
jgi:hypothetical protein